MVFNPSQYCTGYSIAVGGVVHCGDEVLLARRSLGSGPGEGTWALPGGFVEQQDSIHMGVKREVLEETGVDAEVEGLIAVLNRVLDDRNDTYFIFLMKAQAENTQPDGSEIDKARFFTLEELETWSDLQLFSRLVVVPTLQGGITKLPYYPHPDTSPGQGMLYASEEVREQHQILVDSLREAALQKKFEEWECLSRAVHPTEITRGLATLEAKRHKFDRFRLGNTAR